MHKSQESVGPLSLPANASLENLRKRAKTLRKERGADDASFTLSQAQHELAQRYGFASWPKLVAHLNEGSPHGRVRREGDRVWIDGIPALRWGRNIDVTYVGALEAAFRESDRPLDTCDLLGDSALAFRLRWARQGDPLRWCGSGPCGEWPDERAALNKATGYAYDWVFRKPDADEAKRVVDAIDAGRPILAYALQYDMAIIYGYEDAGQTVLVRDYWAKEDPHVMPLESVNEITAMLTQINEPAGPAESLDAALRLAVKRWNAAPEGSHVSPDPYYFYGHDGYAQWIADLKRADELTPEQRGNLYFLNGWTYGSLFTSRKDHAARYLRSRADLLGEAVASSLHEAAAVYERMNEFLGKWDPSDPKFGYVKQKPADTWSAQTRAAEAEHLEQLAALDAEAMGHLQAAVKAIDGGGSAGRDA